MEFDNSDLIVGDRVIAEGLNTLMVGPGGTGKTRLLLQAAAATALEWKWLGFETHNRGPWLFMQFENSCRRIRDDLQGIRRWVGEKRWPQVAEQIWVHTLEQDHDSVCLLDRFETRERLAEMITKINPIVVVWDSLASLGIPNLNSDQDMIAGLSWISRLTKTGRPQRAPIIIHHASPGRDTAARAVGYDRASFGRNSKATLGWSRSIINVVPGAEDCQTLILSPGKVSDAAPWPEFAIRLNPQNMVYEKLTSEEFRLGEWKSDISKKNGSTMSPAEVAVLCEGGKSKQELVELIQLHHECGKATAYRLIGKAETRRAILYFEEKDLYLPTIQPS